MIKQLPNGLPQIQLQAGGSYWATYGTGSWLADVWRLYEPHSGEAVDRKSDYTYGLMCLVIKK